MKLKKASKSESINRNLEYYSDSFLKYNKIKIYIFVVY
jgi:hypothetical protein